MPDLGQVGVPQDEMEDRCWMEVCGGGWEKNASLKNEKLVQTNTRKHHRPQRKGKAEPPLEPLHSCRMAAAPQRAEGW